MLRQSILILILAALPAVAHADVSYRFEVRDVKTGATTTNQVLSKDGKLRMSVHDVRRNADADVIYLPKADEVIMLNHQSKEAVHLTRADMERMQQRLAAMGLGPGGTMPDAMAKRMQEAMKNMPPEARAQAERMLQQMGKGQAGAAPASEPMEIKPTGQSERVAGIGCAVYDVSRGGAKTAELCAAKAQDIDGGAELVTALKGMASFFEGMSKVMGAQAPQMGLEPIDGRFPIRDRQFVDGKAVTESVLKSVSDAAIDDNEFEVPKGYHTRQIMP